MDAQPHRGLHATLLKNLTRFRNALWHRSVCRFQMRGFQTEIVFWGSIWLTSPSPALDMKQPPIQASRAKKYGFEGFEVFDDSTICFWNYNHSPQQNGLKCEGHRINDLSQPDCVWIHYQLIPGGYDVWGSSMFFGSLIFERSLLDFRRDKSVFFDLPSSWRLSTFRNALHCGDSDAPKKLDVEQVAFLTNEKANPKHP